MPPDIWSQHSWDWATDEQKEFYETIALHFDFAIREEAIPTFLEALRENWFRQWPVIPQLVAQGHLPIEALSDGFTPSAEEKKTIDALEAQRFKVGAATISLPSSL